MIHVVLVFALSLLVAWPLGRYLARIFRDERTLLDPVVAPLERLTYRLLGIDAERGMTWRGYGKAVVLTNLAVAMAAFLILVSQGRIGFLNPDGIPGMRWDLALHTASSFITNTNQQHYSGQTQLSYFAHMLAIVAMQVITPTTGLVAAVAILRGLMGGRNADTAEAGAPRDLGNFYVDITRALYRFTLPLAFVLALLLTWQGVPATFGGAKIARLVEPQGEFVSQVIPVGPVAPMVAIKQFGTNGGGWYGANGSVPLENPTPLSNLFETSAIIIWPIAVVVMAGHFLRRRRFGMMILGVMAVTSVLMVATVITAENEPNRALAGLSAPGPNLEGKELRFGTTATALWGTLTTQTSNGSVNGMLDSFSPIGGMVLIVGMLINETFGGVGVGLINFLVFVVLTVFIAGLMVGRTPEIFGRKLEAKEVKLAAIALLLQPVLILGFTAVTLAMPGLANNSNPAFHGVSQVLYEYASAFGNNGSGFEGLGDDTVWWNVTTSICLVLGRFIPILAPMAIAGYLAQKRVAPETAGTLRLDTPLFGATTLSVILIVTLLDFLPILVVGPVAEQLVEAPGLTPITHVDHLEAPDARTDSFRDIVAPGPGLAWPVGGSR